MYQSELHAVFWLHIGLLMHLYAAEPRSITRTFIPLSVFGWQDFSNGVRLAGLKSSAILSYWLKLLAPFLSLLFSLSLFFLWVDVVGLGSSD